MSSTSRLLIFAATGCGYLKKVLLTSCPDKVHLRTRHGLMSGYKLPHALGLLQEEWDRDTCLLPYAVWWGPKAGCIPQPSSQPARVSWPGSALLPPCPSKKLFLAKPTIFQCGQESVTHWRGSCLPLLLCSVQRFWSLSGLLTSASSPKQEIQQLSSPAQKLSF